MTTERKAGDILKGVLEDIRKNPPSPAKHARCLSSSVKGSERLVSSLYNMLSEMLQEEVSASAMPSPSVFYTVAQVDLIKSLRQAEKVVSQLKASAVGLAVGVEGDHDPFTGTLRYVYLSPSPSVCYQFDILSIGGIDFLEEQMLNKKLCKVFYDAKEVLRFFYRYGMAYEVHNIMDIMLVDQLLHSGLSDFTYKIDQTLDRELALQLPPVKALKARNSASSAVLLELAKVMWPKVKEAGLTEIAGLEHETVKAIALMENNGVYFNVQRVAKLHDEKMKLRQALAQELTKEFSDSKQSVFGIIERPFNIDSSAQLKAALIRKGINVSNTDEQTLLSLVDRHPILAKMIEYRKLKYTTNNFTGSLLKRVNSKTGRIHSNFGQIATATGRLNSTDPNLQNIKNGENRGFIEAAPGNLLVVADYKQIDIVVASVMSGETVLLDAIRRGEDLHTLTAMKITGKDNITDEERRKAKAVNFGLLYKMTPYGLVIYARNQFKVEMSLKEAASIISLYHKEYSTLTAWQEELILSGNQTHETRTLSNRRRLYRANRFIIDGMNYRDEVRQTLESLKLDYKEDGPNFVFSVPERSTPEFCAVIENIGLKYEYGLEEPNPSELVNSPVQGTGADIIKLAKVHLTRRLQERGSGKLILTNHDELLVEGPESEIKDLADIVKTCMVDAGEYYLRVIRPAVDVYVGPSWDCKK